MSTNRTKSLRRARAAATERSTCRAALAVAPPLTVSPPPSVVATVGPSPHPTRWGSFLDSTQRELLSVTYWFEPPPGTTPRSVRIRFSGRRTGTGARTGPRDHFVREETVDDVREESGRISVTAKVRDIEPGEWVTSATTAAPTVARPAANAPSTSGLHLAGWSWRTWSLNSRESASIKTCMAPAIKVPALLPFIWGPLVLLGVVLGLLLQWLVAAELHLNPGRIVTVSIVALVAGALGAKLWYAALKRRQHDVNGWCIQGFLVAFTLAAPAIATLLGVPIAAFLDISAPGIFLGAVVGRFGCFLAGCCGGRATTSRFGVWSSDQRVGRRRIPTQLIEAGLALTVSVTSLVAVLNLGTRGGGLFVASVAAYTLLRQPILRLRAERRVSALLGPLVAAAAAVLLVGAVFFIARSSG